MSEDAAKADPSADAGREKASREARARCLKLRGAIARCEAEMSEKSARLQKACADALDRVFEVAVWHSEARAEIARLEAALRAAYAEIAKPEGECGAPPVTAALAQAREALRPLAAFSAYYDSDGKMRGGETPGNVFRARAAIAAINALIGEAAP